MPLGNTRAEESGVSARVLELIREEGIDMIAESCEFSRRFAARRAVAWFPTRSGSGAIRRRSQSVSPLLEWPWGESEPGKLSRCSTRARCGRSGTRSSLGLVEILRMWASRVGPAD